MKRNRKQQNDQQLGYARCKMHARSSVSHPNKYQNMVYEDNRWHNYVLSLYILVVPTIKDFITRLMWLVTCTRTQSINHFWTLRASTHERPPCVLRHMGNAYAVVHIFTHTLPFAIETTAIQFSAVWPTLTYATEIAYSRVPLLPI